MRVIEVRELVFQLETKIAELNGSLSNVRQYEKLNTLIDTLNELLSLYNAGRVFKCLYPKRIKEGSRLFTLLYLNG